MSDLNDTKMTKYRTSFLKEVEANVEAGDWVKMCTQCGACAGSCPLGKYWDHSPQELIMMIRAGKREEVLSSDSMWMCTSCYSCVTRCPRNLPITHIMHGLAHYAQRLKLAPKGQPTREFAHIFWHNMMQKGRANEMKLCLSLYFKDGLGQGVKNVMANQKLGNNMLKAKRMSPMSVFSGHGIKEVSSFHKIMAKAQEIEAANMKKTEE